MKRSASPSWMALVVGVAAAIWAGKSDSAAASDGLPWADARLLAEVLERVKRDYVDPVDDHQLLRAAIHGMVAALDPHSEFLDGEDYEDVKISSSGEYSGVGIEVSVQDDAVVVITPMDGSAAAAAGIRPGDAIVSIDGTPVETNSLDDVIRRMRGPEGSEVRISIERDGVAEPIEFRLKRSRIQLRSVKWTLADAGFGYLRISQFSENTAEDVQSGLKALKARNGNAPLKGLVLDLRNNPGGVLEAAVAVADDFLDKGVIVSAKGRTPESKFEMDATPGDELAGAPIVVLVNAGSASAAEIVAAALQDNHRAKLMGRRTFGKGSVQTVIPLSGERAIKLTTSRYFTPSGASINHKGIVPDIILERDPNSVTESSAKDTPAIDNDVEVKQALKQLRHPVTASR